MGLKVISCLGETFLAVFPPIAGFRLLVISQTLTDNPRQQFRDIAKGSLKLNKLSRCLSSLFQYHNEPLDEGQNFHRTQWQNHSEDEGSFELRGRYCIAEIIEVY